MSSEDKLLDFLKKLGVEDVLPVLKKGGVQSVKGLYDRSFEEWRALGISYGDCCYLDSSKPATIEDDEAAEREKLKQEKEARDAKERAAREAEEARDSNSSQDEDSQSPQSPQSPQAISPKSPQGRTPEDRKKAELERRQKRRRDRRAKRDNDKNKRAEEDKRIRLQEEEEEKRKLQEETDRLLREKDEEEERLRREKEDEDRKRKIEEERVRRERDEEEEREKKKRTEEEAEEERKRKKREEEEEEDRKVKARKKEELKKEEDEERSKKDEVERLIEQKRRELAQKKAELLKMKDVDETVAQEDISPRKKEDAKKNGAKEEKKRMAMSGKVVPSLSLDDLPIPKTKKLPQSARTASETDRISDRSPTSPRTARSPKKKRTDKKEKKDKEDKTKKKERKDKKEGEGSRERTRTHRSKSSVGELPTNGDDGKKKKKKESHKKTLSTGDTRNGSRISPRNASKESMLRKLSLMGRLSAQDAGGDNKLSPREQAIVAGRRNTVSEATPPNLPPVTFTDKLSSRKEKNIIKCQAVARGFLARRFYQRWRVAHEIMTTEQSYVEDLDLILRAFVAPLEKRVLDNDPIIDRNQIYFIFYNLREIHAEHQTILRLVKNRVYNPEEFTKKSVADIFTNNVAKPLSHLYFPYVNNFVKSIKALKKMKRDVRGFAEYIEKVEAKPECHLQDLESLLILPIQRVTRYSILLKSLLSKYKTTSSQHVALEEAYQIIKERLNEINECKRDAENLAYVDELLRAFTYEKGINKMEFSAKRRFVREGTVYRDWKHKESKPIYLLLFNDALVIAKMREKKGSTVKSMVTKSYRVRDVIPLSEVSRVSLSHANEKECRSFVFSTAKKEYEFYLVTTEHSRSWTEIISSTISKASEAKMMSMRRKQSNILVKKPQAEGNNNHSANNNNKGTKEEEDAFAYG